MHLEGVKMDWVRNGLNEGFDFKNPQERDRCGCGESFRIQTQAVPHWQVDSISVSALLLCVEQIVWHHNTHNNERNCC